MTQGKPDPSAQPWYANDRALATGVLRLALGINIGMHGLARLLAGPASFVDGMVKPFAQTWLPLPLVRAFGWSIPPVEAALGLLLTLGLFTRFSLVAGGLFMVALTFGITVRQQWDIAGLQLTYSLAYFALLYTHAEQGFTVDAWLRRRRN